MSKNSEIYFITLLHTVGLLREEVGGLYPEWSYCWGHHNFLVYGTDRSFELEEIHEFPLIFKTCSGLFLERGSFDFIEECSQKYCQKHNIQVIHHWNLVDEDGQMGDRKVRGPVLDVIKVSSEEYVLGLRFQIRGDFAPFKGSSPIPLPHRAPAGYQRMGEVFKYFRPLVAYEDVFLTMSETPEGSSYYLLQNGYRVISVTPRDFSPLIGEDFPEGHLHLKRSLEGLEPKHLKGLPPLNWVILDLDKPPHISLPPLLKLMGKLDECVGLIFHIPMEGNFNFEEIGKIEQSLREIGLTRIRKGLLPSHGREFCLMARRDF